MQLKCKLLQQGCGIEEKSQISFRNLVFIALKSISRMSKSRRFSPREMPLRFLKRLRFFLKGPETRAVFYNFIDSGRNCVGRGRGMFFKISHTVMFPYSNFLFWVISQLINVEKQLSRYQFHSIRQFFSRIVPPFSIYIIIAGPCPCCADFGKHGLIVPLPAIITVHVNRVQVQNFWDFKIVLFVFLVP